jgi:hypothetical protein
VEEVTLRFIVSTFVNVITYPQHNNNMIIKIFKNPILNKEARHWWLPSVILATQEAEIRKIVVQSQPRKIVPNILSRKNPSQKRGGGVTQDVAHCPPKKKKRKKSSAKNCNSEMTTQDFQRVCASDEHCDSTRINHVAPASSGPRL